MNSPSKQCWRRCAALMLATLSLRSMCAFAEQQEEPALQLKMSGTVELGGASYTLTDGYPSRNRAFVRAEIKPSSDQRWTAEIANIQEFGDGGTLLVVGYEKTFGPNWVVQAGAATSDAGVTLPRLRFDLALGRKWLENANLVTTLGISYIQAKDVHSDQAIQFSTAYYFDAGTNAASVEGGVRNNLSNPGSVSADSYFFALTLARAKERSFSVRLGTGQEAYQLVTDNAPLVNFPSDTILFTWREWLSHNQGLQLRVDAYRNPFYRSTGVEASWFWDF